MPPVVVCDHSQEGAQEGVVYCTLTACENDIRLLLCIALSNSGSSASPKNGMAVLYCMLSISLLHSLQKCLPLCHSLFFARLSLFLPFSFSASLPLCTGSSRQNRALCMFCTPPHRIGCSLVCALYIAFFPPFLAVSFSIHYHLTLPSFPRLLFPTTASKPSSSGPLFGSTYPITKAAQLCYIPRSERHRLHLRNTNFIQTTIPDIFT